MRTIKELARFWSRFSPCLLQCQNPYKIFFT